MLKLWKNQIFCWKLKLFKKALYIYINQLIIFCFSDNIETALTTNFCIRLYAHQKIVYSWGFWVATNRWPYPAVSVQVHQKLTIQEAGGHQLGAVQVWRHICIFNGHYDVVHADGIFWTRLCHHHCALASQDALHNAAPFIAVWIFPDQEGNSVPHGFDLMEALFKY